MPSRGTDRRGMGQASMVVRSFVRVTAMLAVGLHTAVGFSFAAENPAPPARPDFRDEETGFAFTAPSPLVIGKRRGHRGHDFVVEVHSADPALPRAGTSKSLCGAALKTQPEEVRALDQATLSSQEIVDETLESMRTTLGFMGSVVAIAPIDFGGSVRGVAAVTTPHIGPDHANVRQYIAIAETPAYRISLSCATTAAAIDRALPLFEALVGTLRIEPAR